MSREKPREEILEIHLFCVGHRTELQWSFFRQNQSRLRAVRQGPRAFAPLGPSLNDLLLKKIFLLPVAS